VDYSLFIMVAVLVVLERLEKRLEATPAAFPPPIFTEIVSVLYASGSLYIGIFRSS
jgi:hypothetical protein